MTTPRGAGYSKTTLQKQQDFISIFTMLCKIWRSITAKDFIEDTIFYFDLNGGPGIDLDNPIIGSPVISSKALSESNLSHQGYICDNDLSYIERLKQVLASYQSFKVIHGDNREVLIPFLPSRGKYNYGLIYADPNGYPNSEIEFMKNASRNPHCQQIDLLLSFGANTVKRISRRYPNKHSPLCELIESINKTHWLIRDPMPDNKQWSFLLGTNWGDFPAAKHYFHPLDSPEGQAVFEFLDKTDDELNGVSKKKEYTQLSLIQPMQNT